MPISSSASKQNRAARAREFHVHREGTGTLIGFDHFGKWTQTILHDIGPTADKQVVSGFPLEQRALVEGKNAACKMADQQN